MSIKRWYAFMLFVPLVLPAFLLLMTQLYDYEMLMEELGTFAKLVVIAALIAGIPYLIFAIGVALWLRHKTVAQIKKLSWFLPWILMCLCGMFIFTLYSIMYPQGDTGVLSLIYMMLTVPVAFLYVAFVHLLTRLTCNAKP